MSKRFLKYVALFLATLVLFGCAPSAPTGSDDDAEEPVVTDPRLLHPERYGGEFRVATDLVCSIMDPHKSNALMASYQWMQYIFEPPLAMGDSGELYPLLCDYELSEDGLTLTLTILPDRYFSDGTQVTIEDVVASIERAGKYYLSLKQDFIDLIVSTEVTQNSVTYTFSEYRANTLLSITSMAGPCYVMKKSLLDELGEDGEVTDVNQLIGSGPYMLSKYQPESEIVLVKNHDYIPVMNDGRGAGAPHWGYFDSIVFCVNLDSTSRTAGLLAGDYHYGSVSSDMVPLAEQAGLKAVYMQQQWAPAIFFNLHESNKDSPVYDKNFRKAVRAALDMEAILLAIRDGDPKAFVLDPDPMSRLSIYHNDIIKNTEWNIKDKELAKQYLAASNYNGETIYWLCSQSASFYKAALVGIEMLKEIGINVEMMLVDAGSHSAMRNDPATGHDIGAWESQKVTTFPIRQTSFVRGVSGGWWEHPEKTRLLEIMEKTVMGSEESIQAYHEFCELVAEEVPWIIFGELLTVRYHVPELELNYDGGQWYYWGSYFNK